MSMSRFIDDLSWLQSIQDKTRFSDVSRIDDNIINRLPVFGVVQNEYGTHLNSVTFSAEHTSAASIRIKDSTTEGYPLGLPIHKHTPDQPYPHTSVPVKSYWSDEVNIFGSRFEKDTGKGRLYVLRSIDIYPDDDVSQGGSPQKSNYEFSLLMVPATRTTSKIPRRARALSDLVANTTDTVSVLTLPSSPTISPLLARPKSSAGRHQRSSSMLSLIRPSSSHSQTPFDPTASTLSILSSREAAPDSRRRPGSITLGSLRPTSAWSLSRSNSTSHASASAPSHNGQSGPGTPTTLTSIDGLTMDGSIPEMPITPSISVFDCDGDERKEDDETSPGGLLYTVPTQLTAGLHQLAIDGEMRDHGLTAYLDNPPFDPFKKREHAEAADEEFDL